MSLPIRYIDPVVEFIVSNAHMIDDGHNRYFYFPYWFREVQPGVMETVAFEDLPKGLVNIIEVERSGEKPDEPIMGVL